MATKAMNAGRGGPGNRRAAAGRPGRPHLSPLFVFLLSAETVLALYLALLVFTRIDGVLLPGNELNVGFLGNVPGVGGSEVAGGRINVLLVGVDRRPEDGNEPTRTDTIVVATVDTTSKTGALLSIPRDLYVAIPLDPNDPFMERINTAYVYGELYDYPGGGIALLEATIERNLGIPINHYVMVDFLAFERVIDDLGGIDIQAEKDIYYANYSNDDIHGRELYIPAGWQRMDGYTALAYARFRNDAEGDLGRIRRQQQVMMAAAEKALALGWLDRAPSLWDSYRNAITTDVSAGKIPGYALLAKQVDLDALEHRSLGENLNGRPAVRNCSTSQGASVLCPNWDVVDTIVHQIFLDPRVKQEAATVEVRNGTADPLLTDAAVEYLIFQGLRPEAVRAGGVTGPQDRTVIYVYNGKEHTARAIAQWLQVPTSQVVKGGGQSPGADVVVVLGPDSTIPQEE